MAQVRLFLSLLLLAGIALVNDKLPASAQSSAGWTLCNHTSYIIEAATGRPVNDTIVVEGWTKIQPGRCEYAVRGSLEKKVHYLYARTSSAHRKGVREWGGKVKLCVEPTSSFAMESPPDCAAMGLDDREFRAIAVTNSRSWSTRFTEIEEYTLERAQAAGVQRLLEDAGVVSSVAIDGDLGPKTRAAIASFLKDNKLSSKTSDSHLIEFLEQVAQERARDVGLTLCNRTENRIWSAIARRGSDGWESRGWWLLEAGGCARAIDAPLRGSEHYVYGELETEDGVRTLSTGSQTFCIARPKFAIVGRESCEEAAYQTALFSAAPAPTNRKLVFEFFNRDFLRSQRDAN